MSDRSVTLQLGEFIFGQYEIPEEITFGGEQRLVVHKLVGGERVIDELGRDDMPLTWSGILYGPLAESRAQFLDGLRIRGLLQTLTWSKFRYRVVVSSFQARFQRKWQIPYTITCTVVKDEASLVTKVPLATVITETGAGLDEAILGDLADALDIAEGLGDSILTDALGAVDAALGTVSDIANAAQDTINGVLEPLAAAQERVVTLISQAGNTVANISTLGGLLPSNSLSENVQSLSAQATGFLTQGRLYDMRSKLGRMDVALSQAGNLGAAVRSVKRAGGDLFSLARDAYDDATKWDAIAAVNDLTDPLFSGTKDLKIPVNPADNGGIPGGG